MGRFQGAADRIRGSSFVLVPFAIFFLMSIWGFRLFNEDYWTTFYGYALFPSEKVGTDLGYWVALVPSLMQIGFLYYFIDDYNANWWAFPVAVLGFLLDAGSDMYFKTRAFSMSPSDTLVTAAETVGLYTIGSEGFITVGVAMTINLLPDAVREVAVIFGVLFSVAKSLTGGADDLSEHLEELSTKRAERQQRAALRAAQREQERAKNQPQPGQPGKQQQQQPRGPQGFPGGGQQQPYGMNGGGQRPPTPQDLAALLGAEPDDMLGPVDMRAMGMPGAHGPQGQNGGQGKGKNNGQPRGPKGMPGGQQGQQRPVP